MSLNDKTATKKGDKPNVECAKPRPKRNRNFKVRPQEPSGLIAALRGDNLDQRTRAAREVLGVRDAAAADPYGITLALARDVLSVNVAIMTALARHLTGPDAKLIDADGRLHELVVKHWPDAQRMVLTAAREVRRMEAEQGRHPAPGRADAQDLDQPVDISSIVLELTESSNK